MTPAAFPILSSQGRCFPLQDGIRADWPMYPKRDPHAPHAPHNSAGSVRTTGRLTRASGLQPLPSSPLLNIHPPLRLRLRFLPLLVAANPTASAKPREPTLCFISFSFPSIAGFAPAISRRGAGQLSRVARCAPCISLPAMLPPEDQSAVSWPIAPLQSARACRRRRRKHAIAAPSPTQKFAVPTAPPLTVVVAHDAVCNFNPPAARCPGDSRPRCLSRGRENSARAARCLTCDTRLSRPSFWEVPAPSGSQGSRCGRQLASTVRATVSCIFEARQISIAHGQRPGGLSFLRVSRAAKLTGILAFISS